MGRPPKKVETGADAIDNILGKQTIKIENEDVLSVDNPVVTELPAEITIETSIVPEKEVKKEKQKKHIKIDEEFLKLRQDMLADVLSGMLSTRINTGPDRESMTIKVRTFKKWLQIIQDYLSKEEANME
ncbi:hypothetical protein M0R19_04785 [Candidatus Pacearchaeota archaeon]|jgi:signal transduction histidine kinase|nr:hypothetical protein [Candidatus Pacearchaeota archaeon]